MKIRSLIPYFFLLLLAGCSKEQLGKAEALKILNSDGYYPRTVDYYLACGDPAVVKRVLDAGLEDAGIVTLVRTVKLMDAGKKPIINFTEKAQPYLLETPAKDKKYHGQNVKAADEEVIEITGVQTDESGKSATVTYTTAFRHLTPFAKLLSGDLAKIRAHKANFIRNDDGWKWDKEQR